MSRFDLKRAQDALHATPSDGPIAWACRELREYRRRGWICRAIVASGEAASAGFLALDAGAARCLDLPVDAGELRASVLAALQAQPRAVRRIGEGRGRRQCAARARRSRGRASRTAAVQDLVYLVERRGRWVSANEIISRVCMTYHRDDSSLVRVHIHSIRRALGEMRSCIRGDLDGRGYMFTLEGRSTVSV